MEQLLGKLFNLSYEIFSIFLPGAILVLFLTVWWSALGPLGPYWAENFLPHVTLAWIPQKDLADGFELGLLIVVPYLAGHSLHWVSRSGATLQPPTTKTKKARLCYDLTRLRRSLFFSVPKPPGGFSPGVDALFRVVQRDFSDGLDDPPEWAEFFPVARAFVQPRLATSLIATYQNKYSLHRSIAAAGAMLFWLSLSSLGLGWIWAPAASEIGGNLICLLLLVLCAIALVWNFSASYMTYWQLFGLAVVQETYSLLHGPKHVESHQESTGAGSRDVGRESV